MSDELWVCHKCQMLGSKAEADGHREKTGHEPERLSDEMSEWVHDELLRQRARRAVAFMQAARLNRRAFGQDRLTP